MAGPGLTEAYVARLVLLARAADIDWERLADEVADHLAEASARHRADGLPHHEAERRAVEEFGDVEALVDDVASYVKGGGMARVTRIVATAVAMLASAIVLVVHMDWDSAAAGTPVEALVVGAGVALGVSVLALIWAQVRVVGRAAPRAIPWLAACAALGTFSAWGGRVSVGSAHLQLTARLYLAAIAFLALVVAWSSRWLRWRAGAGLGLVAAGALPLVLKGALSGTWRPLGSIGEGAANLGIELILVGWVLMGTSWISGPNGTRARSRIGAWLISVGHRVTPGSSAVAEANPESL